MQVCRVALRIVAALSTVSGFAWADNIVLNNSTFSTLPPGGGAYSLGAVPDWTESGSGYFGQLTFPVGTFFNSLPTPTVAFVTGGMLSQDAGAVQAGETYTLSVDVGTRLDEPNTASIALLVNGVTYAGSGTSPTPGNWSTYTATYTALAPDVGAQIYVELIGSGYEANFTDVQLTDNGGAFSSGDDAVPEPSTLALALAGAAAVYIGKRRRGSDAQDTPRS
jgi:hypothetical protein